MGFSDRSKNLSRKSLKKRRAQSIVKRNLLTGVKATNIYSAVLEISENEFLNQIEQDINDKKKRYRHLKQDLQKIHRKARTLSKYLKMENLNNSQSSYGNLKKINQNILQTSNETTQLLNLSRNSSALIYNKGYIDNKKNAFFTQKEIKKKKKTIPNEDSIFSILGFEAKNNASYINEKPKPSIFIDPENKNQIKFEDLTKKAINPIPKRWKLAKIDYVSKNINFEKSEKQ